MPHIGSHSLNLVERTTLKMEPPDKASEARTPEVVEDETEQHWEPMMCASAKEPLVVAVGNKGEELVGERIWRQHIGSEEARVGRRRPWKREERQERRDGMDSRDTVDIEMVENLGGWHADGLTHLAELAIGTDLDGETSAFGIGSHIERATDASVGKEGEAAGVVVVAMAEDDGIEVAEAACVSDIGA